MYGHPGKIQQDITKKQDIRTIEFFSIFIAAKYCQGKYFYIAKIMII